MKAAASSNDARMRHVSRPVAPMADARVRLSWQQDVLRVLERQHRAWSPHEVTELPIKNHPSACEVAPP